MKEKKATNSIEKWAKDRNSQFPEKDTQLVLEYMKQYSTLLIISYMQSKTLRNHFSPIRLANIRKLDNILVVGRILKCPPP